MTTKPMAERAKPRSPIAAEFAAKATEVPTLIITLSQPIARTGGGITELSLREPRGAALYGLNLREVMQGDFQAAMALAQRITTPAIHAGDLANLPAADVAAITGAIGSFFMSQREKEAISRMMGEGEAA